MAQTIAAGRIGTDGGARPPARGGAARARPRGEGLPLRTLALAGIGVGLVSTIAFFRVSLLPSIGDALTLSAAELGVLTMVFGIGRLLTDVPAGRLADRVRPGPSFAAAGALMAAGSFGLAAAQVGGEAYAAAFVLGVGSSIANTTGMTVFSTSVPRARRGTSMAIFSACLLGGQSLGPAVAGGITALGSWRTAEAAAGVLGLGTAALLLLAPAARRADPPADRARRGRPGPIGSAERIVLYGISFAIFFSLGAMPQTLVPIIGDRALGLGAAAIGLALGLGGLCRFVGSFAGGAVSDRFSRKAALVPGLALQAAGIALLARRRRRRSVDRGDRADVRLVLRRLGRGDDARRPQPHDRGRPAARQLPLRRRPRPDRRPRARRRALRRTPAATRRCSQSPRCRRCSR